VADLLQLNGMPRWVAFEERFIVAERGGKVLGALRYRMESKRLLLGLLVVDPWAGEERLARALYAGAGDLARELGVGEVVASASRANYSGEAGYRRRGRYWRLDTAQARESDGVATGGWRRVLSLFGTLAVPFHRYR
jgi:predicted N-acetyltransferase YhbS